MACSRRYSSVSVMTWSLRLRAVCSRRPASPAISVRRRSTAVWMSSSASRKANAPDPSSSRDPGEARVDRRGVGRGDDAAGAEHAGVGARGGDVLGPQAPVDRQRRVEPVECLGRAGAEAAAPEAHLLAHRRSDGVASAPQTRSTWASVISGKKGSAIVDALIASVTGNSPGPWPWASW